VGRRIVIAKARSTPSGASCSAQPVSGRATRAVLYSNVATGDPLGRKTVLLVQERDDFRLPAVTTFDLRATRSSHSADRKVAIDFDVFNPVHRGTVLASSTDARLTGLRFHRCWRS